jgi:uncharacterized protein YdhG (YjbR/CyaY superfamily)
MKDVDTYIDSLNESRKSSLQELRRIILETVPEAEETIQYNMPSYTYHGMLCAFASQKHYMSFYLLDGDSPTMVGLKNSVQNERFVSGIFVNE